MVVQGAIVEADSAAADLAAADLAARGRCTKLHALNAARKQKCHLSQRATDQFSARIATGRRRASKLGFILERILDLNFVFSF